jgi:hypothetical protein
MSLEFIIEELYRTLVTQSRSDSPIVIRNGAIKEDRAAFLALFGSKNTSYPHFLLISAGVCKDIGWARVLSSICRK